MFFFKQKTAYELRMSDWSSDVCSSDLRMPVGRLHLRRETDATQLGRDMVGRLLAVLGKGRVGRHRGNAQQREQPLDTGIHILIDEIGRASCRERVCQYV